MAVLDRDAVVDRWRRAEAKRQANTVPPSSMKVFSWVLMAM